MERKKITFFVVSDSTQATRKFSVSLTSLRVAAFLFVTTAVLLTAFGLDYFSLLLESHENKMLKAENLQLKNQFQVVETKLSALENALERVKTFSTKLKLITNVEDENRGLKLAMTAGPKPNQAVDDMNERDSHGGPNDSHRGPANIPSNASAGADVNTATPNNSLVGQEETPIDTPPPTNEAKGELAIEGNRDYKTLSIRLDGALKDTGLREQSVLEVWESLSERQSLLNATPSLKPARGWYTSKFGYRISPFTGRPAMHAGLDIAAAPGSPVFAPADGVVTYASYDEGYGKLVTIDHGYGVMTRFGHNSQVYVQVGQRVSRWDVISAVGNTGRSTGPHLHYEVRLNNVPVDPANYILDE